MNDENNSDNFDVKFLKWESNIKLARYGNNRLAIKLVSAIHNEEDMIFIGSPIATATVNVPEEKLADNEIIIKNSSENEGILECLQNKDWVSDIKRYVFSGYEKYPVVEKTEKLIALENSMNQDKSKKLKK